MPAFLPLPAVDRRASRLMSTRPKPNDWLLYKAFQNSNTMTA